MLIPNTIQQVLQDMALNGLSVGVPLLYLIWAESLLTLTLVTIIFETEFRIALMKREDVEN